MSFNPLAPWYPAWWGDRQEPLSGDVSQWFKIFSPTITVTGRGEPALEAEIVQEVATYGAQLGPIIDLVLALAEDRALPPEALAKLQDISRDVEARKERFRESARDRARRVLDDLRKHDPDALAALLADYRAAR